MSKEQLTMGDVFILGIIFGWTPQPDGTLTREWSTPSGVRVVDTLRYDAATETLHVDRMATMPACIDRITVIGEVTS